MDEARMDDHGEDGGGGEQVVVRRSRGKRIAIIAGMALLALLVIALAVAWMARRPIASNVLQHELERRGVDATYDLTRVGLRTQEVRNLVIGDPKHPDLTAKLAQVQMRIGLDGSVEVYRIVARGVRLRGEVRNGKVHWGQVDKLLPPPSGKPFALPDFVVDIADSTISLKTPNGPLGFAIQGSGNLSGGFKGHVAAAGPSLDLGTCTIDNLRATLAVAVKARHPHVEGPVTLDQLICPKSNLKMTAPRLNIASTFNESFTNYDGHGRMDIAGLVAGENGLANFVGNLTFEGDPEATYGTVDLAAQRSRLAAIYADRTRLKGKYRLGITKGTLVMVGDYAANSATLPASMTAGLTGPLEAAESTPIGPIATAMGNAVRRSLQTFDASGSLRMVNFPGGGAVRIESANVSAPTGARINVAGRDGITYYWPSGNIRVDSLIAMTGGGLPTGRIDLRQPRGGAALNGVATFQPYTANGSRLALTPVRFQGMADGSTRISTIALLDGPFADGQVKALRVPIEGRIGGASGLSIGNGCVVVSFQYLKLKTLQLGPTKLPVCPVGGAIISQRPGGALQVGATVRQPVLAGRLGETPLRVAANGARVVGKQFAFTGLAARLGQPDSPVVFNANRLEGTFVGSGISGTFAGADATIGTVPVKLSEGDGKWRFYNSDLSVNAALTVSDRNPEPRFYPLRGNDVRFTLDDDGMIRANGTLVNPASGIRVTDVSIEHQLSTGVGHAILDVPGITFGPNLQPDELTRLTEGVVALVNGTIFGQGRIDWSGSKVTSTGDFATNDLDLAAPFGPVTGIKTSLHFTDLLGLETAPGQVASIASINPGILVENGVIQYQLLPGQLVKVQRGEWPFMGGRLILRETILDFSKPSAKRLTFEVVGLNAKTFVDTLGFSGIEATGIFDGVLPMIFDENGGRIVGGRLDSRAPGGSLSYEGEIDKANLGLMGGIAFDALRDLRFKSMIIRLDGDLAGEFTTRLTIEGVALGQTKTAKLIRGLLKRLPIKLNVTIKAPFRALIATAKSFRDPRALISDVLPVPLDEIPGIVTEVRRTDEDKAMTQTPPGEPIPVPPSPDTPILQPQARDEP
jgi:hypothetical protein